MSIEVISIGSSSSGNSYIIRAGGRVLLLDVGLTAKKIVGALSEIGLEPEDPMPRPSSFFFKAILTDRVNTVVY